MIDVVVSLMNPVQGVVLGLQKLGIQLWQAPSVCHKPCNGALNLVHICYLKIEEQKDSKCLTED